MLKVIIIWLVLSAVLNHVVYRIENRKGSSDGQADSRNT